MELNSWTLFEVTRLEHNERLARGRQGAQGAQRRGGLVRHLALWSGQLLLACGSALLRYGQPAAASQAPLQR